MIGEMIRLNTLIRRASSSPLTTLGHLSIVREQFYTDCRVMAAILSCSSGSLAPDAASPGWWPGNAASTEIDVRITP